MNPTRQLLHSQFDLRTLEIFLQVCEYRSMTLAARHLGLTQPAVSQAIKQLELSLGTELLDRQSRPLLLTPAGEILRNRAGPLISEAHNAQSAVRHAAQSNLTSLRIGLVDSFAVTIGPELIKHLQEHTHEVRVWSGLSRQLAAGLLARDLDLLVSATAMEDVANLQVTTLYREPFCLALPRNFKTSAEPDLKTLSQQLALVRYSMRSITGVQIERYLKRLRIEAPQRLEFDGSESVLAMVQEGIGWALTTPLCLLQARADFSRIRLLPLVGHAPCRNLYMIQRADESNTATQQVEQLSKRLLKRLVRDVLRKHTPFAIRDIRYS